MSNNSSLARLQNDEAKHPCGNQSWAPRWCWKMLYILPVSGSSILTFFYFMLVRQGQEHFELLEPWFVSHLQRCFHRPSSVVSLNCASKMCHFLFLSNCQSPRRTMRSKMTPVFLYFYSWITLYHESVVYNKVLSFSVRITKKHIVHTQCSWSFAFYCTIKHYCSISYPSHATLIWGSSKRFSLKVWKNNQCVKNPVSSWLYMQKKKREEKYKSFLQWRYMIQKKLFT